SSDIVAHVENDIHDCFISYVSEDIDVYLSRLYEMSKAADQILHDRYSQISTMEQTNINKLTRERQKYY
ncbi:unnamed protein product, partial [Rotaria sp. Silwood2]